MVALCTMAQFPRLPLASTETDTPMRGSLPLNAVEAGVTCWLSETFDEQGRGQVGKWAGVPKGLGFFS